MSLSFRFTGLTTLDGSFGAAQTPLPATVVARRTSVPGGEVFDVFADNASTIITTLGRISIDQIVAAAGGPSSEDWLITRVWGLDHDATPVGVEVTVGQESLGVGVGVIPLAAVTNLGPPPADSAIDNIYVYNGQELLISASAAVDADFGFTVIPFAAQAAPLPTAATAGAPPS